MKQIKYDVTEDHFSTVPCPYKNNVERFFSIKVGSFCCRDCKYFIEEKNHVVTCVADEFIKKEETENE